VLPALQVLQAQLGWPVVPPVELPVELLVVLPVVLLVWPLVPPVVLLVAQLVLPARPQRGVLPAALPVTVPGPAG
jgi:hypothetical protein